MEKRTENIFESIKNNSLKADSAFMFHCTMCGDCCRNRDDILLNPQDLFKLAKGLKMQPKEVVEKYCECYIGNTSRMPIVRLKPVGADMHCAFLDGNKCAVQDFKPTVCAMFPIGRFTMYDKEDDIGFMFTNPQCGDKREIHSVREWLGYYGIPIHDKFYIEWTKVLGSLSMTVSKSEKSLSENVMNQIWSFIYVLLYLNYDTEKEFMPQFLENSKKAVGNVQYIENLKGAN